MSSTQPFDLDELAQQYEILGELAGGEAATVYIARQRDDGADVQITVHTAPQGDEGNALSHLAADVNLLAGQGWPGLVEIRGGKWVGQEAFAIVTRRVAAPTLDELLFKREEQFSLARIAAILSQINGVIMTARERKVVHRCVTARTIYVEPGADRITIAFTPRALPLTEMPGVEEDARTVAQIARAMLTRGNDDRAAMPLRELRPGLPEAVLAQTDALLSPSHDTPTPDVVGYIGAIAMADALKAGEDHLEQTRNLIEDQKRAHQAQLEQERKAHDEEIAAERAAHQKTVEEQAKRFQKEREEFEEHIASTNAKLEKEHAALAAERESHRRDCEKLSSERTAHEREIREVRERLEWETAALATQAELYARTDEFKTPLPGDRPAIVASPGPPSQGFAWIRRPKAVGGFAVLALLVAVVGVALKQSGDGPQVAQPARVVDSVAGGVESVAAQPSPVVAVAPVPDSTIEPSTPDTVTPANGVPADLLSSVAARADSAPVIPWWRRVLRRPARPAPAPVASVDTAPRLDTIFTAPVTIPRDTIRRDTIRRDTIRRDTVRRDTSVIRDTLGRPRDTLVVRDTLSLRKTP